MTFLEVRPVFYLFGRVLIWRKVAPPTPATAHHLAAYLFDVGKRIAQMQSQQNLCGERQLLDVRAMTYESLRAWEQAAKDLERVVWIEPSLEIM